MELGLTGSVAVVTGASSGIGEATARTLAGLGFHVVAVARRAERIERVAEEVAFYKGIVERGGLKAN